MIRNPYINKQSECTEIHDHFSSLRPNVKEYIITNHFEKDYPDYKKIVKDILSCSHSNFTELHKFEEHIEGGSLFRAKKNKIHFVYAIEGKRLIFLRAFHNFDQYRKFLSDKKEIKHIIENL